MRVHIGLPSTFTSNLKNRAVRAYVIGSLARVCAVHGVRKIFVYHDPDPLFDSHGLGRYIVKLLRYAITPPWMKKDAFPINTTDRYFGVLPPLKIKAHLRDTRPYTWGLLEKGDTIRVGNKSFSVDEKELRRLGYPTDPPAALPVNVEEERVVDIDEPDEYIGYYAFYVKEGVGKLAERERRRGFKIVATSRKGISFRKVKVPGSNVLLLFGGPNRGLHEIDGFDEKNVDAVVNLFPDQETETVRTEEAVNVALWWAKWWR